MPDIKFVKSIFGADLTTVIKAHKSPVPVVVEKCIKEIESRGNTELSSYFSGCIICTKKEVVSQ